MQRGYYFAHELEAGHAAVLAAPPHPTVGASGRVFATGVPELTGGQRKRPRKKKITDLPTNDVETSDKGGAGKDVS